MTCSRGSWSSWQLLVLTEPDAALSKAALAPLALDITEAPVERAERAFKAFLDISGEHPDLVRLITHKGAEGGEQLDYALRRFITLGHVLEPLFDAVRGEGFLREFDNRTIFLVLVLAGAGPTALSAPTRAVTRDDLYDAGQRERYARRLLGLLFRSMS